MPTINANPMATQQTPTRLFLMDPVKSVEEFRTARAGAYNVLVGLIVQKGQTPAAYDVRSINPADDFSSTNFGTINYGADWSVAGTVIGSNTSGSVLSGLTTVLSGTMPQDRFMDFYGTSLETPGTPPEIAWVFKSGSNVKTIWFLQDLLGYEHPRAVSRQVPAYGPSDSVTQQLAAVSASLVVDAHLTLWAEPTGTTITASNLTA